MNILKSFILFGVLLGGGALLGTGIGAGINLLSEKNPIVSRSIVKVLNAAGTGGGTGWITTTKRGNLVIVTNDHVCEVATNGVARIENYAGRTTFSKILERDFDHDLCTLEATEGPTLTVADNTPSRYDSISTFGHPLLEPAQPATGLFLGSIVTSYLYEKGSLGCKNGTAEINVQTFFGVISACEKTEATNLSNIPTYPGNSGSPVLNTSGEVVGVINSADSRTNHGAFVPLPYVKDILAR